MNLRRPIDCAATVRVCLTSADALAAADERLAWHNVVIGGSRPCTCNALCGVLGGHYTKALDLRLSDFAVLHAGVLTPLLRQDNDASIPDEVWDQSAGIVATRRALPICTHV